MKRIIVGLSLIAGSMVLFITPSSATQEQHHPVTICHRTHSDTNQYVTITVDDDAVDGVAGNQTGKDHYGEHQGPVWEPGLKDSHTEWGDIIPPEANDGFDLPHDGLNWNEIGQAWWNNDCNNPEQPPTTTTTEVTTTTTEAPTTTTTEEATTTTVVGTVPTNPSNPDTPITAQSIDNPQPELAMTGIGMIIGIIGAFLVLSGVLAVKAAKRVGRING